MELHDFIIRDYTAEDYPQLTEFWELTGLGNAVRGDDRKIISQTLNSGGKLLVMSQVSTGLIMGSSWMTTDGRRLYLHHFGIHPNFQGRGLSMILMEESMVFANKLGLQTKLEVHKNNTVAIHIYKKFGFKYLGHYQTYIRRDISLE